LAVKVGVGRPGEGIVHIGGPGSIAVEQFVTVHRRSVTVRGDADLPTTDAFGRFIDRPSIVD
jgi:hypothetical protein